MPAAHSGSVIVGREAEFDAIADFLVGGYAALAFVGEAGIGKTTLWEAGVAQAKRRGIRVLSARPSEPEANLSFAALGDLLAGVDLDELPGLPAAQRHALGVALAREEPGSASPQSFAVAAGLTGTLRLLGERGSLLVAVDDVPWLDRSSADALAFAARRLGDDVVRFLLTRRLGEPTPLERALEPRGLEQIDLEALSIGALRVQLETQLGYRYARPVLARIASISGGNPLFALEVAQALGPAPELEPGSALPVPGNLRELVADRVTSIPSAGRRALLAAASLADPHVWIVEQASSARGLAQAEQAGLVRIAGDRATFAHPLYASAIYGSVPTDRRRRMHERLAELVSHEEERARHLALATVPPDERIAATLEAASSDARARGAWEAAGELLEMSAGFTPPELTDTTRRRAIRAAEHHLHAGDRPRARSVLESVLADTPAGWARSEALRLLAEVHSNEDSYLTASGLLDEALAHADDPSQRVAALVVQAFVAFNLSDFAEADRHAALAVEGAAGLGDDALLAEALGMQAIVDFLAGRGVDWSRVEHALELEDTNRITSVLRRPSAVDAALRLFVGRYPEAREKLDALRRSASNAGDESDLAAILWWQSWLETDCGNLAAAAVLADDAEAHAILTGDTAGRAYALGQRSLVHAHLGHVDAARSDAGEAAAICASLGMWQPMLWVGSALGLLELSLGNPEAAWAAVRELTEQTETHPIPEPHVHQHLPVALEALIALGELERAEPLIDWFETRAREVDRAWALAHGARARGLLLAACGEDDEAEQTFGYALAEFEQLRMRFEQARTRLIQGEVQRRRRQKRAARESLEQASEGFRQLGARLWEQRARAELARIGGRRRRAADGLTPAELQVARLAATGLSNKDIARQLVVTVNTVEAHLKHVYAKLGVHSRGQLALRLGHRATR